MLQLLSHVNLSPHDSDTFIWAPHKKGLFSVKSFSEELAKYDPHLPSYVFYGLWRGLVPHRIEIFTWLTFSGKLNTKDKLVRLAIINTSSNALCVLCTTDQESCDHLFIHCPFGCLLWNWWLRTWNVQWASPSLVRAMFEQWKSPIHRTFFKKIWPFFIIIWTLWKEWNSRCFENISCSTSQLQDLVLLRMCWWIKGWGEPFPYTRPHIEVMSNPQCLNWYSTHKVTLKNRVPQPPCPWSPPSPSSYKWNVDTSMKISEFK